MATLHIINIHKTNLKEKKTSTRHSELIQVATCKNKGIEIGRIVADENTPCTHTVHLAIMIRVFKKKIGIANSQLAE
jgi:hypothetical protein